MTNPLTIADVAALAKAATPAIENLRTSQRQLDADGSHVGVSRQALEESGYDRLPEIAALLAETAAERDMLIAANNQLEDALPDIRTDRNTLRNAIKEIVGHLGAASRQRSPNDDKIIADHIDDALAIGRKAL